MELNNEPVPENGPEDGAVSFAEVSGMQVEVPFIAASQRKVVQIAEDDSIVVVGQARQRKRKRSKLPTDVLAETASPKDKHKETGGDSNEHEPFDFQAVPNILDDNPNVEDTKKKKQKKQRSGKISRSMLMINDLYHYRWYFLWRFPCSTQSTQRTQTREPVPHLQVVEFMYSLILVLDLFLVSSVIVHRNQSRSIGPAIFPRAQPSKVILPWYCHTICMYSNPRVHGLHTLREA